MTSLIAVTGASGYIGGHIIQQLLQKGYRVRGLVRNLEQKEKYDYLYKFATSENQLEFVQAELQGSEYEKAFVGVDSVIHTASPYFYTSQDPQKEIVDPAVQGTRDAIKAAISAGVKRIVITSSGGAILHFPVEPGYVFTCEDWNNWSSLTNNPYFLSKKLAEEEAWKLYKENSDKIEVVVVNPLFVLGPLPNHFINTSVASVKNFLLGQSSPQPGHIGVVDVRDVAAAHIIAMEKKEAAGKRLICCGSVRPWKDIPQTLSKLYPQYPVKSGEDVSAGQPFGMDTQPLKDLGLESYIPFEETLKDTVQSLIQHNLIQ